MENFLNHLSSGLAEVVVYFIIYVISSFVIVRMTKNKDKRQQLLSTFVILKTVLTIKFGSKAGKIVEIWMDGLKKVEDGEFSNEDRADQFLRYIRISASTNGISLSNEEIEILHTLVLTTFQKLFPNKPETVVQAVKSFQALK